jgi:hypothetical protein
MTISATTAIKMSSENPTSNIFGSPNETSGAHPLVLTKTALDLLVPA